MIFLPTEFFTFLRKNKGKSVSYIAEEFIKLVVSLDFPLPSPDQVQLEVKSATSRNTTEFDRLSPSRIEYLLSRLFASEVKYQRADWKRAVRAAKVRIAAERASELNIAA